MIKSSILTDSVVNGQEDFLPIHGKEDFLNSPEFPKTFTRIEWNPEILWTMLNLLFIFNRMTRNDVSITRGLILYLLL